jgi:hypothetical protein
LAHAVWQGNFLFISYFLRSKKIRNRKLSSTLPERPIKIFLKVFKPFLVSYKLKGIIWNVGYLHCGVEAANQALVCLVQGEVVRLWVEGGLLLVLHFLGKDQLLPQEVVRL